MRYASGMSAHSPSEPPSPRPAPDGWALRPLPDSFGDTAGPYYFRLPGPIPGVGFYSETRHRNLANFVHGGALLSLADMALFDICHRARGAFRAVTVSLSSEFLAPAPIGAFIEATGEMMGGGKSLLFSRGMVSANGRALLSFSGTLKVIG